jgi:hypothetical protein
LDLDSITTDGKKLQEQSQLKGISKKVKGKTGQCFGDFLALTMMVPMTREISSASGIKGLN